MTDSRVISNSEMNAWLDCKRKYFYAYDLGLMPIRTNTGPALRLGNFGHDVLEIYFNYLKENPRKFESAKELGLATIAGMFSRVAEDPLDFKTLSLLSRLMVRYFDYFPREHPNAEILEVEQYHELPLTDEFSYGMKLDLYFRDGPFFYLTDHKFTYDFWRQTKLETKGSGQTSKYYFVLKAEGYQVDQAMINQIRYREKKSAPYTDEEMFRESTWKPTQAELDNNMLDQLRISREIANHRSLPMADRERESTRSLGRETCEYCFFSGICVASLRGDDISADIETDFTANTYGYNKESG